MDTFIYKGKNIAFHKTGEGPALFFLHGFCEDQSMWTNIASQAPERGFTFISLDLPGFGHSDTIEDCSIEEMARLVNAFCEAQQLTSISLLGHSMGGYIALAFAEKYAFRLSSLGIIHSHPYEDGPEKKEARKKSIEFVEKNGTPPYVRQLIPKLFPPDYAQLHPQLVEPLINKAIKYQPKGIINALEAMKNRPERTDILRSIKVPVLFVVGELDDLEPTEKLIDQTHLPEIASIHILKNFGHMGIFEAPEKSSQIIFDFAQFSLTKA